MKQNKKDTKIPFGIFVSPFIPERFPAACGKQVAPSAYGSAIFFRSLVLIRSFRLRAFVPFGVVRCTISPGSFIRYRFQFSKSIYSNIISLYLTPSSVFRDPGSCRAGQPVHQGKCHHGAVPGRIRKEVQQARQMVRKSHGSADGGNGRTGVPDAA